MAMSFMKRGQESIALAKKEEVEQAQRKEEMGKMWRFWLEQGESRRIIFVDGDFIDGNLLPPRFYEHNVEIKGRMGNHFVCVEQTMPELGEKCPICEDRNRYALMSPFTIIDLTPAKSKKTNEVIPFTRKLFMATPTTYQMLNTLAKVRGGIVGWEVNVTRTDKDKSPRVGDVFDFIKQHPIEELKTRFIRVYKDKQNKQIKENLWAPADYESEIVLRHENELRQRGFGTGNVNAVNFTPEEQDSIPETVTDDAVPVVDDGPVTEELAADAYKDIF